MAEETPYLALARLVHPTRVIRRDTELAIDGFTRSGVTFAVLAFQLAQRRPVRVAHHLHAPAQLIAAARRGLPATVLLRSPEEAVLSAMIREPYVTPQAGLRAWTRFYEKLLPHRGAMTVAPFEDVTSNYGSVIESLNRQFGTAFERFEQTERNVDEVFAIIQDRSSRPPWSGALGMLEDGVIGIEAYRLAVREHGGRAQLQPPPEHRVPRPSAERDRMKEGLRERLLAHDTLLARARDTHRAFLAGP